jgi:hypothetical protein
MTATKIALRRLGPPYADETLRISGAVTVPPGFDPVVSGLRVVVRGAAGNALIDADVPGGPYDRAVRAGWTTRPGAVSYRNRNEDPAGRAPAADVRALAIRSSTSGVAKLKVKGVAGTYRVGRSDPPAKVTVVFDPPTAASGRCAEAALSGCTAAPDGRQISCR